MFASVFEHSVPARKRCKTGAFRHPNALLTGGETRVDFFATNACNLPKYALEHVCECFWAFGSGTKTMQNGCISAPKCTIAGWRNSGGFFRNERMQSS